VVKKMVAKHAQVEARIGFISSNGEAYREESLEDFIEKFREFAKETWPERHNFTVVGSYYIVDGKVCLPQDFDRETMDRKPGTYPPSWSLSGEDKKEAERAERDADQARRKEEREREEAWQAEQKKAAAATRKKTVKISRKPVPEPTQKKVVTKKILRVAR
jgi:hypothetical protein